MLKLNLGGRIMVANAENRERRRDLSIHKVSCTGCPACTEPKETKVVKGVDVGFTERELPDVLESLKNLIGFVAPVKKPSSSENPPE